jgi:DNA primase
MTARRGDLLRVLQDAHAFYRAQVTVSWVPDHLNRRNLYGQMEPAQIGYAPAGWTVTTDHLRGRGYADELLVEAGLSRAARTGRLIDHFRDRLMVPLRTGDGELVGFIGRCQTNAADDVPKYLNSPQTPVFSKHEVLYGLGESLQQLKRGSMPILVEVPLDRLAMTAAVPATEAVGIAPCGTALTALQVAALVAAIGPHRPIAVALDPDVAGRAATLRAWEVLTAAGARNLLHISLPEGKDPAELVRNGRTAWLRGRFDRRRPLGFAVADQRIIEATPNPDNASHRVSIARHILRQDLRRLPATLVGTYVAHVAPKLDLDAATVTAIAVEVIVARNPRTTGSQ